MNPGVFLLLFVIFFVLVAVVVWVVKDSRGEMPIEKKFDEAPQEQLLDEAMQWLEDLAKRQEGSKPRRLH